LALLPQQRLVSVSIDGTVRQWSISDRDLQKAREEAANPIEETKAEKPSVLTADEEQELADLMGDESS
jgi:hypothetical protein